MDVGVGVTPLTHPDAIVRIAELSEQLGYTQFGTADGWTYDAYALLSQIATRTSRIKLQTGVISIWSRTPAALAMGAATVQIASGGRFRLGLGTSSPPLVEGLHGLQWQRPLARMRSTVVAIRALLSADRSPSAVQGARALRLGLLPEQPVPIMLAGLTPRSIRLAGELADCWLPFMWARSHVGDGRALLDEGQATAEAATPTTIAAAVPFALAESEETARTIAAGWLLTYLTRMGPLYPRMLREQLGFGPEIDALLAANANGGALRLPPASEALAREVTLMATYDEAPSVLRAWLDADIDSISLILPPGYPEPAHREMLEAAAPAPARTAVQPSALYLSS
jgi:alkanesulfonate monooxygenase SsuD/methylene tetrahydromethanopterin reductase-like flavin-dependent oxidoreductase (luciferase family)